MKVFISAHRGTYSPNVNAWRHLLLGEDLLNLLLRCGLPAETQEVRGVFGGVLEDSYCVRIPADVLDLFIELSLDYEQDAILYIDHDDTGALVFHDRIEYVRAVYSSTPPDGDHTALGAGRYLSLTPAAKPVTKKVY
jgi:hypothetical protein